MMKWKWMLMNCFEIDWFVYCCWEFFEYGICWVEDWDIELLMIKDWFELLWLWIEIVDMEWNDQFMNCLCFDGNWVSYLNGWLRCGKLREKMRLKAYAILWDE